MSYLGVPVSNLKLYAANLIYVGVKVEKMLATWQVFHLSSSVSWIMTMIYSRGVVMRSRERW
jgi:hypothetical protein